MKLFLLRHAEAADLYPDAQRPLTHRGTTDTRKLGKLLTRQEVALPTEILCSPYLRARQTIEVLLDAAEIERSPTIRDGLTPEDDPLALLPALNRRGEDDLLIVGHNPHLAILAGTLLGGASVHFRKCSLLCLERFRFSPSQSSASWSLSWMLTPKLFR